MACEDWYALLDQGNHRKVQELNEDHILSLLFFRRARGYLFGDELFADPAWDILLELYAARLGNRQMTDMDLAKAINLPISVVRRWIMVLEQRGLASQSHGPSVPGSLAALTPEAESKMAQLAARWASGFLSIC